MYTPLTHVHTHTHTHTHVHTHIRTHTLTHAHTHTHICTHTHTHINTGTQSVQSKPVDDGSESTTIPTIQARWEEESNAVDGHAAHLCIANLRDQIISTLTKRYEEANKPKESKPSDTSANSKTEGAEQAVASGGGSVPTVPHPSDQATPASPRDPSSTVDQLRSSLRQVADALAQTVAAVRETRQLLGRTGESVTEELREGQEVVAMEGDQQPTNETGQMEIPRVVENVESESEIIGQEIVSMETTETQQDVNMETSEVQIETTSANDVTGDLSSADRAVPPLIPVTSAPSTSQQQPTTLPAAITPSTSATAPTVTSASASTDTVSRDAHDHPILATFDGSQESARATLASTDPEDPLYTFLSAVAGAPTPPIAETSAPLSPPSISSQPAATSPRLPVFTQFQSNFGSTSTESQFHSTSTAIPMSVIQDARNLGNSNVSELQPPLPSTESQSSSQAPSSAMATAATSSELQALSDSATDVTSAAADIASQLTNFFETTTIRNLESQAADSDATMLEAATLADSLAQQLVRAVTQFSPPTSGGSTPQLGPTPAASNSSLVSASTVVSSVGMQSPSPSDTLAPLISSLQMPTSAAPSRTFVDQSNAERESTSEERGSDLRTQERVETGQPSEVVVSERGIEASESQAEGAGSVSASAGEDTRQSGDTVDQSSSGATAASGGGESSGASAPDVIDPTFLAALPDSIRHEVMAQYERERSLRHAQQEAISSSISAEFLSALPSEIQEEVRVLVCVWGGGGGGGGRGRWGTVGKGRGPWEEISTYDTCG